MPVPDLPLSALYLLTCSSSQFSQYPDSTIDSPSILNVRNLFPLRLPSASTFRRLLLINASFSFLRTSSSVSNDSKYFFSGLNSGTFLQHSCISDNQALCFLAVFAVPSGGTILSALSTMAFAPQPCFSGPMSGQGIFPGFPFSTESNSPSSSIQIYPSIRFIAVFGFCTILFLIP